MTPGLDDSSSKPFRRTLLLVDDEPHILSALKRALRADGYTLLASSDPIEALSMLEQHHVDVILADHRMPGMSGVEFLRQAHISHPETVRIVLSGYTDLQFITDAINEGAIYKFLTKPWDDEHLRRHIQEAFRSKEIADENKRLTESLHQSNLQLERQAALVEQQSKRLESALGSLQEILQLIPWPILGLDDTNLIAMANFAADNILSMDGNPLLGREANEALSSEILDCLGITQGSTELVWQNQRWRIVIEPMGRHSCSRGRLMALLPCEVNGT